MKFALKQVPFSKPFNKVQLEANYFQLITLGPTLHTITVIMESIDPPTSMDFKTNLQSSTTVNNSSIPNCSDKN